MSILGSRGTSASLGKLGRKLGPLHPLMLEPGLELLNDGVARGDQGHQEPRTAPVLLRGMIGSDRVRVF
jgi:hypothetical protein